MQENNDRQQKQKRGRKNTSDMTRIEQIRRRKREKRMRAAVVLVLVLAALLAYLGGLLAPSINFFSNMLDSARIALSPGEGWPLTIEPDGLLDAREFSGGVALLDESDLVLLSSSAAQLRRIPHGYADPAVAIGGSRAVLYNRGGSELRVESRTRTLLTKEMPFDILTAGCAKNGAFAVATGAERYNAQITVYDASFNEVYYCYLAQDTPMRIAFTDSGKKLAAACMDVQGGAFGANIHLYDTRSETAGAVIRVQALPLEMVWISDTSIMVVCDSFTGVYDAVTGEETARYDYGGRSVLFADYRRRNLALCFGDASRIGMNEVVVIDQQMQPVFEEHLGFEVEDILLTGTDLYVLRRDVAAKFKLDGSEAATVELENEGQFLIYGRKPFCVTAKEILQLAY